MHKLTVLGLFLFITITNFTMPAICSTNETKMLVPMGTLVLKPPSSVEAKKNSVFFPHSKHFIKISCHNCHHNWNGTENIKGCTTSGCHVLEITDLKNENKKFSTVNKNYKKAYHAQCIGCHKKLNKEIEKIEYSINSIIDKIPSSGPTGCIECHSK